MILLRFFFSSLKYLCLFFTGANIHIGIYDKSNKAKDIIMPYSNLLMPRAANRTAKKVHTNTILHLRYVSA